MLGKAAIPTFTPFRAISPPEMWRSCIALSGWAMVDADLPEIGRLKQ